MTSEARLHLLRVYGDVIGHKHSAVPHFNEKAIAFEIDSDTNVVRRVSTADEMTQPKGILN